MISLLLYAASAVAFVVAGVMVHPALGVAVLGAVCGVGGYLFGEVNDDAQD